MARTYGNTIGTALFALTLLLILGCGQIPQSQDLSTSFLQATHDSSDENLARELSQEIKSATDNIQSSVFSALAPTSLTQGSCKPTIGMKLVGIALKFQASETCKLRGEIAIVLLPLRAQVDLEIIGMKHVESMQIDLELQLKNLAGGTDVGYQFENGVIQLHPQGALPFSNLTFNGRALLKTTGGKFSLVSRHNAFAKASGSGLAVVQSLVKEQSLVKDHTLKACSLSQGVGDNIEAGTLSACLSLMK